jgi:outer membrane protein
LIAMMRSILRLIVVVFAVLAGTIATAAQTAPPSPALVAPFTLDQAIQYAAEHYPTVRAALEQVAASTAGVDVARSTYLPRLDSVWQSSLATTNNVFGQVLPQPTVPGLTGPVLPTTSAQGVWSSVTGALAAWEAFDFGLRRASVASAEASVNRAVAGAALTRLEVQGAVGVAFLNTIAAQRAVVTLQADVDRRDVLARAARILADNQLRPGADASRADAERAAALTRLIQAQQSAAVARIALTRVLGGRGGSEPLDGAAILDRLPAQAEPRASATLHPLAQARQASIEVAEAQERLLARSDFPRLYLQSSLFARGSGASPTGELSSDLSGLALERVNWAAGVQIVFPNVFGFSSLRARKAVAAAATRVESALYEEAMLTLASQRDTAAAMVEAARAIAANTPLQLAAAQQSEAQARARYDAGLATLNEVADAQSLLAHAEVQAQLARIEVWRASLAEAVALGSLEPFLALLHP